MCVCERFLKYVEICTASDRESMSVPSSHRQFNLAHLLAFELREMGVPVVHVDNSGIVYAKIPATDGYEEKTPIGFLAHLDTFPDVSGEHVRPQMIKNYDGRDVALGTSGLILKVSEYPHLELLKGETLITTDGTTLLGADDKAGIAEIMCAMEYILKSEMPHGAISIAFVADEEIGRGADHFDVDVFGAKFAYSVDGWEAGSIIYENFNAAQITIKISGKKYHTGAAKNQMVNAQLVGMEINQNLPPEQIPALTDGREGFYHLLNSKGDVSEAVYVYEVRDYEEDLYQERIDTIYRICENMNEKYGEDTVFISVKEKYKNMKPKIEACFQLIASAEKAGRIAGVTSSIRPVRGGLIGSKLSFMGLPCPSIGSGGYAYHGPMEHITVEAMERVKKIIIEIVRQYADDFSTSKIPKNLDKGT